MMARPQDAMKVKEQGSRAKKPSAKNHTLLSSPFGGQGAYLLTRTLCVSTARPSATDKK